MNDQANPPAFVILAGGSGTRLGGVRKSDLRIGNERLIDRIICRAGHRGNLLVSTGPHSGSIARLPPDAIAVPDHGNTGAGPLAGLIAAAEWLTANRPEQILMISVAVDTPFLPLDYSKALRDAMPPGAAAAVAAYRGTLYPTNAIWRIDRLAAAGAALTSGAGPRRLLTSWRAQAVANWDSLPSDPFASINSLRDLLAAQRTAGR